MTGDPASGDWHLDKRIPVVLVFTMLVQFGGIVWWVSQISARVDALEKQALAITTVPADIASIKQNLRGIEGSIGRIETIMDKAIDFQIKEGK